MIKDKEYVSAWTEMLQDIEEAREQIHSSKSNTWYRGHSDINWKLLPTIYRHGDHIDPDDLPKIHAIKREIRTKKSEWEELLDQKKALKKTHNTANLSSSKPINNSIDALRAEYHTRVKKANQKRKEYIDCKYALLQFKAQMLGERDLFDEFVFNTGRNHDDSSWKILAEMRHHGVPTRLLDWSASNELALFFALEAHRNLITQYKIKSSKDLSKLEKHVNEKLPQPCIWILNPFKLAEYVTKRRSIWDFTRDTQNDYYRQFLIHRKWDFDGPVPIFPPWKNPRIEAQKGYFTVHGNDKRPLEEQLIKNTKYLRVVKIKPKAAIFSAKYLTDVVGLNNYKVFQDIDTLGEMLSNKHFRMHEKYERKNEPKN